MKYFDVQRKLKKHFTVSVEKKVCDLQQNVTAPYSRWNMIVNIDVCVLEMCQCASY